MKTLPKCPIRSFDDFAIWYSPGVATQCRAIQAEPELVDEWDAFPQVAVAAGLTAQEQAWPG